MMKRFEVLPGRQQPHFTEEQGLDICLDLARKYAATSFPMNSIIHPPWLVTAVNNIRAGEEVTREDIRTYQAMGTS